MKLGPDAFVGNRDVRYIYMPAEAFESFVSCGPEADRETAAMLCFFRHKIVVSCLFSAGSSGV